MLRAARSALIARPPPIASRRPTIARAAASSPAMGAPPAPPTPSPAASARAADLLSFIDASWTQYHAVAVAASRLDAAGFARIHETDAWALRAGGRYYFTRGGSTLVAFAVGGGYKAGNGFHVVGAHTDSPCLKLKPVSAGARAGYAMVNVEPYGGGLWSTWFDRDLTVAGRVLVKGGDGKITARLVAVDRPLLRRSAAAA
jgi:aspartyl aminopeptidase